MSFNYSNSLPTDRDWVRMLINDHTASSYFFEDEELDAIIAEQNQSVPKAVKYLAAAQAMTTMHEAWIARGRGIASKKVSALSIVYGTGGNINVDLAMETKISQLRRKGAALLSPAPFALRMR